jgi:type IV pilus assembly protein PilB
MKRVITKKLGKLLIENGIISEEQLSEALRRQKERGGYIGQNLVDMGYTTEEEIVSCLTVQYGFPYLPLRNYEINPDIIKLIPKEIAATYYTVPIDRIGDVLTVTMANPLEEDAVETIEKITGYKVEIFVSTGSEVQKALNEYYGASIQKKDSGQMLGDVDMHEYKK